MNMPYNVRIRTKKGRKIKRPSHVDYQTVRKVAGVWVTLREISAKKSAKKRAENKAIKDAAEKSYSYAAEQARQEKNAVSVKTGRREVIALYDKDGRFVENKYV